ncbi:MAG: hypothetical protein COV67_03155 [Nitrospinae bacterium CG11_big_fil_rev_8_21_14_0_20_56_8]|nr:MAG: hypothetical protein COV67_03155 [Nitrospinae bacterium CG11_big_fil_rev_8_21_14_0_20_56_8]
MVNDSKKLNILIADDDEDDVFLIKELIREGLSPTSASIDHVLDAKNAILMIGKNSYDVCVFDYLLGDKNGLDLLLEVRRKGITMPILFLTGQGDQEVAVEAMKYGASDYLVKKNLSQEALARAIRHALQLSEEEKQRKRVERELKIQGQLLEGVSEATNCLLTGGETGAALKKALEILGKAAELDLVFILEDAPRQEGAASGGMESFWKKGEKKSPAGPFDEVGENPEHIPYEMLGMAHSYLDLREQKTVILTGKKLTPAALKLFKADSISSLVLVPIQVNHKYFGALGFGTLNSPREWSESELSILNMAAAGIGGKIKIQKDEDSFRSIVEGTSSRVGEEFFRSLVRNLALAMPVRCAYVSELISYQNNQCSILAGWEENRYMDNFTYSVGNSPSEDNLAGMMTYFPDKVLESFPNDSMLQNIQARSFAGVPLFDSSLRVIGHLSIADDQPFIEKTRTLSILKLFAARAGVELERKRAEDLIRSMAYHDALTGLPNRVLLNDRLSMALAQAQRNNRMMAILYVDFDGFKSINDTYGHNIGDLLLQGVADRFRKTVRKEDTVARLGGDEFILLMPVIHSTKDAASLARKLIENTRPPIQCENHSLGITLSIGISIFPQDGDDTKTLLKAADDALYVAKSSGRDQFQFSRSVPAAKSG